MELAELAPELLTQIFLCCGDVRSVLTLSSTCQRLHSVANLPSKKLPILASAVDAQYGPLDSITQLLTYNKSQPAHKHRSVPISLALLKQAVDVGRVAAEWEALYPFKKWKEDYVNRRFITPMEKRKLRRALYRIWLFSAAFHNSSHPRDMRLVKPVIEARAALLHNFNNLELAEMLDIHNVLRDVVGSNICPSNGAVARRFKKRMPDGSHPLIFGWGSGVNVNIHVNYPVPAPTANSSMLNPSDDNGLDSMFHSHLIRMNSLQTSDPPFRSQFPHPQYSNLGRPSPRTTDRYRPSALHDPASEAWGDAIAHYYVVEDMLKLHPGQVLYLKKHAPLKQDVLTSVRSWAAWGDTMSATQDLGAIAAAGVGVETGAGLGWDIPCRGAADWFDNNGETFVQTLEWVLGERGETLAEMLGAVEGREVGVVVEEDADGDDEDGERGRELAERMKGLRMD
ncbi:MAG: hypothetical protein M1820_000080 [Bogoriella megaspora]|nr:MAG: hypothetical protein M1820_000080 [Bogoriella megaspora]